MVAIIYIYIYIVIYICWLLLSNQSFFRQIPGYVMGVDDHRVYKLMMKGDHEPTKLLHALT